MQGSLRERRPGNWELIVQLPRDRATGRSKQLSRTHLDTKREAQRALAALVADVSAGPFGWKRLTDVETLRQRARENIEQGPITLADGADRDRVVSVLNEALATELVCSGRSGTTTPPPG